MFNRVTFIVAIVILALFGCSDSSDESASIKINSFNVQGTQTNNGDTVVLDQNSNNGDFRLSWSVDHKGVQGYRFTVYLTESGSVEDTDKLLDRNCDMPVTGICGTTDNYSCNINAQFNVSCGGLNGKNIAGNYQNITQIVGEACTYDDQVKEVCD
ncbi:hypothetical protein [Kaarinaea lacus]